VKLRVAEALRGKQIVLLPTGGAGVQKLDVNRLIEAVIARDAAPAAAEEPAAAAGK
jgi:hypothetical protein